MAKSAEQLRVEPTRDQIMERFRSESAAIMLLFEGREDELPPVKVRYLTRAMAGFVMGELCVPLNPEGD